MYINPGITGLDWLASQILAVAAGVILAVVIVRQYAARHTLSGRAGVVAALLLPFLPVAWNTALYATTLAIKPGALAPMRLEADPGRMAEWEGETCFSLPVKLVGADPSLDLDPLGARVAVDAPGFHLQGGWQRETSLRERGDGYREKVCMARSDYTRAVDQSDRHGTVAVTATVAFAAWPGSVQSRAWLGVKIVFIMSGTAGKYEWITMLGAAISLRAARCFWSRVQARPLRQPASRMVVTPWASQSL